MTAYWLLLAHFIGDYLLQSDWMAQTKTKSSWPAFVHATTYTVPFTFLTTSWPALLFIASTHFVIDRWRLARFVVWAKNWMAPPWLVVPEQRCTEHSPGVTPAKDTPPWQLCAACKPSFKVRNRSWTDCSATGYTPETPAWLAVWLLIIADNTLHLVCNGLAVAFGGP